MGKNKNNNMEGKIITVLKSIISEGYKLKAQHNNPDWKQSLENAEKLLIELKKKKKQIAWKEKKLLKT